MECLHPKYLHAQDMVVPCGRCAFCGATRRSDWSSRLHYEAKKHIGALFLTLTYSNNNLKWVHGCPQLVKSDLQNFFKRLRKWHKGVVRYYAVGEYGSKTYRPHYHILLFGDVPEQAILKAWARQNRSTKKWYGLGHVHIGKVTQASVAYCLGYMVNGTSWKMKHKRARPFNLMSQGIGKNYLSKAMIEWHRSGRKNYMVLDGQKRHLPRYYKVKIFSKIDLVRIAVRDQKAVFKRMVEFIRAPSQRRMVNPLGYYKEVQRAAALRIKFKSKENLII